MLKVGLEEMSESACRWPIGDPTTESLPIAAFRPQRADPIAPAIAGWPISRRIREYGTASVTWPSNRWRLPKAATRGFPSTRRTGGARPRQAEAFRVGAILCLSRRFQQHERLTSGCSPGAFGEFLDVERNRQSPARNGHGRRSHRHGDFRPAGAENILTVDDVQGALTTAQSSLISSPAAHGSLDGAKIIGEIKDLFARRERGQWNERRG